MLFQPAGIASTTFSARTTTELVTLQRDLFIFVLTKRFIYILVAVRYNARLVDKLHTFVTMSVR